jgi:hypothetical protein
LSERPLGTGVILRLHSAEQSDDVGRVFEPARREQLIRQAILGDTRQIVDLLHCFVYLLSNARMTESRDLSIG